jgi:hypothetical protein
VRVSLPICPCLMYALCWGRRRARTRNARGPRPAAGAIERERDSLSLSLGAIGKKRLSADTLRGGQTRDRDTGKKPEPQGRGRGRAGGGRGGGIPAHRPSPRSTPVARYFTRKVLYGR